jgi:hypothetical protein
MRGSILFFISFLIVCNLHSQEYSAKDFLYASSLSPKKLEGFLNKKKFVPGGSSLRNEVVVIFITRNLRNVKRKKIP